MRLAAWVGKCSGQGYSGALLTTRSLQMVLHRHMVPSLPAAALWQKEHIKWPPKQKWAIGLLLLIHDGTTPPGNWVKLEQLSWIWKLKFHKISNAFSCFHADYRGFNLMSQASVCHFLIFKTICHNDDRTTTAPHQLRHSFRPRHCTPPIPAFFHTHTLQSTNSGILSHPHTAPHHFWHSFTTLIFLSQF